MSYKPCIECPFMKRSMPNYLGGFTAEETVVAALSEDEFDCHITRETYLATPCRGRLLFASANFKSFRDPEMEEARKLVREENDMSKVLSRREFMEHHR